MIKKSIFVVLIILLVIGLGSAVVDQSKQYQNKKQNDAKVAAQKESEKQKALEEKALKLERAYNDERVECEKGKAAYDSLAANTNPKKIGVPQPVCGPAVLR